VVDFQQPQHVALRALAIAAPGACRSPHPGADRSR
jgi:hypothetical protein